MRSARILLVMGMVLAALVASCSSSADPTGSTSTTAVVDGSGGIPPGYPVDVDVVAPLVITAVAPDPIPVTGTDGMVHVVYELEVLNTSPRPASITTIETLANGPDGAVVAEVDEDEVLARSVLVANFESAPFTEIPAGRTALVLLDDTFPTRADVPSETTHRIEVSFGAAASPELEELAARYPDTVTQIGGTVRMSDQMPVVIGPPLAGSDWVAGNGCCGLTSHRGAIMALGGRLNAAERYAIDWVRFDLTADPLTSFRGDGSTNEDYLAYDASVLAVADGTVVSVVSDLPDQTPQQAPSDIALEHLGGNSIIIDIGGGNFAFYAHLIPGSATVKAGDRVTRGQVIGRLGNSGNTTEAHLHFHVSRAPVPLSGDNVPYAFDRFEFVGSVGTDRFVTGPDAGERTMQMPLEGNVINFPAAP